MSLKQLIRYLPLLFCLGLLTTVPVHQAYGAPIATTTTITADNNPSVSGQPVHFTVTVKAGGSNPALGTVTLNVNGSPVATKTFPSGSDLTYSDTYFGNGRTIALTATFHDASSTYADSNDALTQTVNRAATAVAAPTSSLSPSTFGQAVTLTAQVSVTAPGTGTPSGQVTFFDNGVSLGTGGISGTSASLTTSAIGAGSRSITASYGGDGNYAPSATSAALTQQVNKAATSLTTPTASPNPSASGDTVTFATTLSVNSPGAGTPTGTIAFQDGGSTFATATVTGANTYTVTYSGLTPGSHTITAVYSGDTSFSGTTSGSVNQLVKALTSTVIDSVSPAGPAYGQSVTFHVTVTGTAGTPSGSVQFKDGGTALGPAQTLDPTGQLSFAVNTLTAGLHSITAVYSGDASNSGSVSSPATSVTVVKDNTSVSTPSPSSGTVSFGQGVTFSVTVTSAHGQVPAGTVTFQDNGVTIGTGTLDAGGNATSPSVVLSATPTSHPITAIYGGNANFNGSTSGSFTETVNKAATNTAVASSSNPSSFNKPVTFTATVTSTSGVPTGTVQFQIDGADVKTDGTPGTEAIPLTGPGNNQATLTTASLTIGTHTVTAAYSGDNNYATSGGSLSPIQTVTTAATTVAVASDSNPSSFGQAVKFTATVTGANGGTPTGTVIFKDGGTTIGTGTLGDGGTPDATSVSTSALVAGTHTITAVYSGDTNFAGASGTLTPPQTVTAGATTTTVSSSANPSTFGQPVTFTATVAGTGGTPTGTVTLKDTDGSTLGTGTLNASGIATVTISSLSITSGSTPPHAITAVYNSDGNFASSTGTLSPPQTVNQAANTVIAASSNNPSLYGQLITFSVSVTGGSAGTPTGTVTFLDGATAIGSATLDGTGKGTFTTSSPALAAGTHSITAKYNGDTKNAAQTSPGLAQVVNQAATSTTIATNTATPTPGQPVTFTATVADASPNSSITPTAPGTVQFQLDGANVKHDGTPGNEAIALNSTGQATLTASSLSSASHSVTASYSGDSNFLKSANSFTQPSAVPTITRLTPNSELENDPTFEMQITGSGFIKGAVVNFNGNAIAASQVASDGTGLTVTVLGKYLSQPGTVSVSVSNPQQPTASNALPFQIKSPNGPTLFSGNPTGVLAGLISTSNSLIVTLTGSNFTSDAVVGYTPANGSTIILSPPNNVKFVDSTHLQVAIPGSFLQSASAATITVRNNDPGGGGQLISNPVTFTIGENPGPFINSLNPGGISVNGNPGTNNFTLNVLGGNFLPGAIVTFTDPQGNATVLGTDNAVVNATGDQVSVSVSNSLVRQSGKYNVQVTNVKSLDATTNPPSYSYNGALPSSPQAFLVSNLTPIIDPTKFSPSFAVAGATTAPNIFALTVTGSNFDPGATATSQHSTVIFNNTTLSQNSVRVINSTTLVANIDASLVSSAGLASLVVSNIASDGITQILSNPVQFPINPVYARGTYPSHGIAMFSVPYDYSGSNPFDIIKEATFAPGLSPGKQYFGLSATSGSNILTDLQDLLSLNANGTAKIAQWSPQGLAYVYASAPPKLDLQLQLGRAYWGVNFADKDGALPGGFGVIKLGAPATVNPYPVPLAKGWNMIGDPYPTAVSIFGITVQSGGRVYSFSDAVANGFISPIFWSYDGGASYTAHFPGKTDPNSPVKDTLDPFAGYWLLCNTDCQLLVPRP